MYEIKVRSDFSSAHNLRNYSGKCEKLHGHNWIVEAVFRYEKLDRAGLAVDFRIAKKALKDVTEELDHAYINEIKYFRSTNPTSENIARFIYGRLKKKIKSVHSVAVWENENSCAVYSQVSR